ncbi:MAG: K+/H+ antiporter subunit F [Pseudomonadota bacterium]
MINLFSLDFGDGPGAGLLTIAMIVSFGAVILSQVLAMVRVVLGPSVGDRILALDTMVVNAIALIVLLGISQGTSIYFEASLIIAMLGFVSTVALARFLLRGDIIE